MASSNHKEPLIKVHEKRTRQLNWSNELVCFSRLSMYKVELTSSVKRKWPLISLNFVLFLDISPATSGERTSCQSILLMCARLILVTWTFQCQSKSSMHIMVKKTLLRSYPSIALRIPAAHNFTRD